MSYGYGGPPGAYGGGPPGAYNGYPPQSSSPPGMAPGMGGMGMSMGMGMGMGAGMGPPGFDQSQHPLPARPGAPGFQIPPNMPKFDMNASVIRLGTGGPPKPEPARGIGGSNAEPLGQRRAGLGHNSGGDRNIERERQQIRESMQALMPPKSDEVLKTIFVGNITEGCRGDNGVEDLLRSVGNLRKWTRAIDADNQPCTFGFAEFEDSEGLEMASEVLTDVMVPVKKQPVKKEGGEDGKEIEKTKLLVIVDDASKEYAANWAQQRDDSEEYTQNKLSRARQALEQVLARFDSPYPEQDYQGDIAMADTLQQDPMTGEVVAIAAGDDDLALVPAEMRETVAAEIQAFRDRSNRRDLERLKKEEEMEARERHGARAPIAVPTGPGGAGANGIPLGPKALNAPLGPKGLRGVQIPKDYQNGVSFTNGTDALSTYLGREPDAEDTDASDSELEQRRRKKKDAEQEKTYLDYERKWLNRERTRGAALERERQKDELDKKREESIKEDTRRQFKEWDDTREEERAKHSYYVDRGAWAKNRQYVRAKEIQADTHDRREEERENEPTDERARANAVDFLDQQAEEIGARVSQNNKPSFKISLGAAAQKARQAAEKPSRKAAADVENLLDIDEGSGSQVGEAERKLVPIKYDTAAEAAALTPEERAEARKQIAYSIPQDKDGLFAWKVKWASLKSDIIEERLKPYVEKRSMEYLGVVEELVWDVVKGGIEGKEGPEKLVEELEDLLGEETEGFVKKVWRMVVFYSESEGRGLGGE